MFFKKWKYILKNVSNLYPEAISVFPMYILNEYLKYSSLADSIFIINSYHFAVGCPSASILALFRASAKNALPFDSHVFSGHPSQLFSKVHFYKHPPER